MLGNKRSFPTIADEDTMRTNDVGLRHVTKDFGEPSLPIWSAAANHCGDLNLLKAFEALMIERTVT